MKPKRDRRAPPFLRFKFDDGTTGDVVLDADFARAQDAQDRALEALDDEPILSAQASVRIGQRFDALAAQNKLLMRQSAAGRQRLLGLTWTSVESTWDRMYAECHSVKRSDASVAAEHGCSTSLIRTLRQAAWVKTKRVRRRP